MNDVSNSLAVIKEYILKRIAEHPSDQPVKFMALGYEACQGGLFCLFLDTRPDAGPDGTWTVRLEGNSIDMPGWPDCADRLGDDFVIQLGEGIKALAIQLREGGAFKQLAKQDGCEFGVEEMEGNYGWPRWEERGNENLA